VKYDIVRGRGKRGSGGHEVDGMDGVSWECVRESEVIS